MPQIFHRSTNTLARATIFGAVFVLGALIWMGYMVQGSPYTTYAGVRKPQPVPFSHQHHVAGLGIDCRYCHTSVETSSFAGIPPTKTCMNCHSQIWTNAALLEPVRQSYVSGQSLQWTRVNQLPDFVYFNHSIHVTKGIGCNTCHGPVDRMPLMYQQNSLQMEWCLDCHRHTEENLRPRDQVFNMRYEQPSSANPVVVDGQSFTGQIDLGKFLQKKYEVRSVRDITSCNTCHR
ncbi:MAG TPA: cytochrome c3 family protein [Candidatus Binatia bacterium]|nr:cytochrome c3 family protein [Candidatus Binatia bacterium]